MRIMEKKMETIIMGYIWGLGLGVQGSKYTISRHCGFE